MVAINMKKSDIPDPLADLLKSYCNVNAVSISDLTHDLRTSINPEIAKQFRQQLADAISKKNISPEQYESLTGEDFDTQEELNSWLQELWNELFDRQA
jgi:hypothetical protein